eukprot:gene24126-66057_t
MRVVALLLIVVVAATVPAAAAAVPAVTVDVMPFLGRTNHGGPFDAYYEALSGLGAEFVRFAPWTPNPRVTVPELTPPDCSPTRPQTNWNSTLLDGVVRDFMAAVRVERPLGCFIRRDLPAPAAVCGPGAAAGACRLSVVPQLSTMPSWMYVGGYDPCGHWHPSGLRYRWWGLSVLNEDEHGIKPDDGSAYMTCFNAISAEVRRVNPDVGLLLHLAYYMDASHHPPTHPPRVATYHWGGSADNATAEDFFTQWDAVLAGFVPHADAIRAASRTPLEMALNEFIPFVTDWCDCTGVPHLCPWGWQHGRCPNWENPDTSGGS